MFLCFFTGKAHKTQRKKILPCGGCNVVICCEESQKFSFAHKSRVHTARITQAPAHCLSSAFNFFSLWYGTKDQTESLVKSIEILKSFQISVLKRQKSRFFFGGEEPKGHRNFIAHREISWVEQCIKYFFRSRALCWLNNMSKKSIKTFSFHLGVSLILFLDLWAWIFSYGEK